MKPSNPIIDVGRKLFVTTVDASGEKLGDALQEIEFSYGPDATWDDVLQKHRVCLLMGQANSGKSCELELLNLRLRSRQEKSFLMPLRRIREVQEFADLFDRQSWTEAKTWQADPSTTATFLLDSIDEVELCQPGAFEDCLRRLRRWLTEEQIGRARWIISTRPGAWSSIATLDVVRSELCLTAAVSVVPPSIPDDDAFEEDSKPPQVTELAIAVLKPLRRKQALRLLREAFKVDNVVDYEEYARNLGLTFALQSPGNLKWFSSLLDANPRPTSRLTAMDLASCELVRRRPDEGTAGLDSTLEEVRRLSAAAMLCGTELFARHDAPGTGALSLRQLLSHQVAAFESTLMSLPLVSDSGFGSIKFVPQHIQVFLAARWLAGRVKSDAEERALADIFIRISFVGAIVPTQLLTVVGWLATLCPSFRARVLSVVPHAVLFLGDRTQLPQPDAQEALRKLVQLTVQGYPMTTSGLKLTSDDYWQAADESLVDQLCKALEEHGTNDLVAGLVLQILQTRRLPSVVQALRNYLTNGSRPSYLQTLCISALEKSGSSADVQWGIRQVAQQPVAHDVAVELALALFHADGNADEFARICSRLHSGAIGLQYRFESAAEESNDDRALRFAAALLEIGDSNALVESDEDVEVLGPMASAALGLLKGYLRRCEGNEIPAGQYDAVLALLEKVRKQPRRRGDYETFDDFAEIFEAKPPLRVQALVLLLENVSPQKYYQFLHHSYLYVTVDLRDEVFLRGIAETSTSHNAVTTANKLIECIVPRERSQPESSVDTHSAQAPPEPAVESASQGRQSDVVDANRRYIADHLDDLRNATDLWFLTKVSQLVRAIRNAARYSAADWQRFGSLYGSEATAAVQSGLRKLWREAAPLADLENPSSTYRQTVAGLIGLDLELSEPTVVAQLTPSEVDRALSYAPFEINGFPAWMKWISELHPTQFDRFFVDTVLAWSSSPLAKRHAEQVLDRCSTIYARPVPEILIHAIWSATEAEAWTNTYSLATALRMVASLPSLKNRVTSSASSRSKIAWQNAEAPVFTEWFSAWMHLDAAAAVAWIEVATSEGKISLLIELASHWHSHGASALNLLEVDEKQRCNILVRLYVLLRVLIPQREDVPRYGGYSPTARDQAAQLRDGLPSRIAAVGGAPAYRTFEHLCCTVPMPQSEARWFHRLAYDVAVEAAKAPAWSVDAFLTYARNSSLPMQDEQDTFVVVRGDLDEIVRNLCEGEFSIREMLHKCREKDVQLWMARELQLLSRGRYWLVREPEQADNTAPDVVAHSVLDHRVTLELKLGDDRTLGSLRSDLRRQLLDDYLKSQNSNFGLFVVMWKEKPDPGRRPSARAAVEGARLALERDAEELMAELRGAKHVVVKCFVCPLPVSPRNEEKAQRRTTVKARKSSRAVA